MTADHTDKIEYFYNTRTQMVERGRQSSWEHLMGPYDTFADATQALEIAKKRNQAWSDDDAAWEGEDS
jgi:hypothetical protein